MNGTLTSTKQKIEELLADEARLTAEFEKMHDNKRQALEAEVIVELLKEQIVDVKHRLSQDKSELGRHLEVAQSALHNAEEKHQVPKKGMKIVY